MSDACRANLYRKILSEEDGVSCEILSEPSVVRLDYELTWMKRKIDLRKLAKLRESGLSLREIARATGMSKANLWQHLKRVNKKGG